MQYPTKGVQKKACLVTLIIQTLNPKGATTWRRQSNRRAATEALPKSHYS